MHKISRNEALLNFPLALFFRRDFVKAALERSPHERLYVRLQEATLMSLVGYLCADPELSASLRQPTVGTLVKLTEHQLQAINNMGLGRAQAIRTYLEIFGLKLSATVTATNLNEIENALLASITPKDPHSKTSESSSEDEALLDSSVDILEVRDRASNCMKNANIKTIRDLVGKTEKELLELSNFGRVCLNEVKEQLRLRNLALKT